jgi:hypothetical protein
MKAKKFKCVLQLKNLFFFFFFFFLGRSFGFACQR